MAVGKSYTSKINNINYQVTEFIYDGTLLSPNLTQPKIGSKSYSVSYLINGLKGCLLSYNSVHFNNMWGKPYRSMQDAEKDFKELVLDGHIEHFKRKK